MVRNFYSDLFRGHPNELARARNLSKRIFEFTEFIVDILGIEDLDVGKTPTPHTIAVAIFCGSFISTDNHLRS